jgi:hypothetical protein
MRANGASDSVKTREVESSGSAISRWETDPLVVFAETWPMEEWEAEEFLLLKSLPNNARVRDRHQPARTTARM